MPQPHFKPFVRTLGRREEYTRSIEPTHALAAETFKLKRTLSDLVNQAYGLTPAETELMWKTASARMPIMVDRITNGAKPRPPQTFKPAAFLAWVQKQHVLINEPS